MAGDWPAREVYGRIVRMPRLRDIPIAVRKIGALELAKRVYYQVYEDSVMVWASALAYSWLFALFPLMVFLLTLLPYVPEDQKQQVISSIETFAKQLPSESAETLNSWVQQTVVTVLTQKQSGLMSFGLLLALWAASGGMSATMSALDRCYDIDTSRSFFKHRGLAILLTIVTAALMLVVVVLLPVGGAVIEWVWNNSWSLLGWQLPRRLKIVLDITRWTLGLFLLTLVLNVVYHFGCQAKRKYRFLTPGAVFCVLTWVVLGLGFRYYIDHFAAGSYNRTYGAVGSVIILLFLFYMAAIVLLVGAEINSEIDYTIFTVPRGTKDFRKLDVKHDKELGDDGDE